MTSPPRSVVVCAPKHLGDAVCAAEALRSLIAQLPGAHIDVLCMPQHRCLFEGQGVAVLPLLGGRPALSVRRVMAYRRGSYDAALLLGPSLRAGLEAAAAGIEHRVGVAWDGRGPLLTDGLALTGRLPFDRPLPDLYQALIERLLAALGAPRLPLAPPPASASRLPPSPLAEPLVVLNPHGRHPTRRWPVERFAEVGRALAAKGARLTIIGGPSEGEGANALSAALSEDWPSGQCALTLEVLAGPAALSIEALRALLASAQLLISNDSGPLHLAASVGTPIVGIFGATDPLMTGLARDNARLLATPDLECHPCYLRRCHLDLACLDAIPAQEALNAANALLGWTGAA